MTTLATGLTRYFSPERLEALRATRVGIIGAGGLGSNVAVMLARSGVRHMTIVDKDIVDASNLNRQAYLPEDVGTAKVLALSWRLLALEPAMRLAIHETTVTQANAANLFEQCPIVVEAVDDAAVKAMLYGVFAPGKELYVTASGMGGAGFSEEHPMTVRRPRPNVVAVGDFTTPADAASPPLAPRVMQAAALEADAVLAHILRTG